MYSVLYTASHDLKCGTQLLKFETDKIIRSSIAQDRLDGLALISIEHEEVTELELGELVDKFANSKARRKAF